MTEYVLVDVYNKYVNSNKKVKKIIMTEEGRMK